MEFILVILDFIKLNIENNFYYTFFIFFIITFLYFSLSLPGNIILVISSGYFFGIFFGFLLSLIAMVSGSLFFFIFISSFIKKFFPHISYKYSNKVKQYLSNSSLEYLIIFRIIPGPPLMLQNLILSILDVKKLSFIISSALGFSPIAFICVFFGFKLKDLDMISQLSFYDLFSYEFIIFIICIIIFLLFRILYKK